MHSRSAIIVIVLLALVLTPFAYEHRHGLVGRVRHYILMAELPARGELKVGDRLPAIPFTTMDGSKAVIAARPGRLLYLDVFTTWCPDCVDETPALEQLRRAVAAKPVDIVGLDQEEDPATVARFVERFGLTYPIYIDYEHITTQTFGVHYIPVAYLIDGKGIVRGHIIGRQSLAEMERLVDDALRGRAVGFRS